jgi:hypothetical protein
MMQQISMLSSPPRKRGPKACPGRGQAEAGAGAPILASLGLRFYGNDGSFGKTLIANSFWVRLSRESRSCGIGAFGVTDARRRLWQRSSAQPICGFEEAFG